ncbi:MAG: hypothetical protein ACC662_00460 [Planctomycetota bacterium]
MGRVLATFLVVLATLGVATGGILRPCNCDREGGGCGLPNSQAKTDASTRPCCGSRPSEAASPEGDERHGCRICHKPAPPTQEAGSPVRLDPPTRLALFVTARIQGPASRSGPADHPVADVLALPPPWRLDPPGLSIFLL